MKEELEPETKRPAPATALPPPPPPAPAPPAKDAKVLLRDSPSRSFFLTKVGIVFMMYSAVIAYMCYMVTFSMQKARLYYSTFFIKEIFCWLVGVLVFTKLLMLLLGSKLKGLGIVFFMLDCVLTVPIFLGLFFYFDHFTKSQYIWSGHYVVIVGLNIVASFCAFTLSTLMGDTQTHYNLGAGIGFMLLGNVLCCYVLAKTMDVMSMRFINYLYIVLCFAVFDFYIAMNSFLVVTVRTMKLNEGEQFYCYCTYWTDWFSHFWIDLLFGKKEEKVAEDQKAALAEDKTQNPPPEVKTL